MERIKYMGGRMSLNINAEIESNKELTKHEKIDISLKDISKAIKQQLKKEFPCCKFSVSTEYYSMGQSLHISIMETDFKVILPFEDITPMAIHTYVKNDGYRTEETLKELQNKKHHQLSCYCDDVYNKDIWNNGVFLTEKGFNLVKRIIELTNKFNWNNSDSQIDYFDVKFYLHLNIGKWDKPFIEGLK